MCEGPFLKTIPRLRARGSRIPWPIGLRWVPFDAGGAVPEGDTKLFSISDPGTPRTAAENDQFSHFGRKKTKSNFCSKND